MSETLSTQMQDYFAYLDDVEGAIDLATVREPRIGEGPVRPVQLAIQPPRRTWNGWVAAGVASAAVLILVGGLAWLLRSTDADAPVAGTVAPTAVTDQTSDRHWSGLTDDLPEGVKSGTLTTSTESARWAYLSSDEFVLPSEGRLELDGDGGFSVWEPPSYVWQSDGGIEWRLEESPVPAPSESGGAVVPAWVPYADGSYARFWLIGTDPIEIWNSEGAFWVAEDLSDLIFPESDEFVWDTEMSPDYDGSTWDSEISLPVTRYGEPFGKPGVTQSILHVWFAGPGIAGPQTAQTAERLLIIEHRNEGDSVTMTDVPWFVTGVQPHAVALFGTSGSVYAYVRDWASGQTLVWHSNDGHSWTELDPLADQLGILTDELLQISVLPAQQDQSEKPLRNQLVVATVSGHAWESTDGVTWTPAPQGYPADADLIRLESGWFATQDQAWWMHLGGTWVSLAELGLDLDGDTCQVTPRAHGETTVFFATSMCSPPHGPYATDGPTTGLWIISLNA